MRDFCFCSSRASHAGEWSGVRGADVELARVDADSVNDGDVERSSVMDGVEGVIIEFDGFFREERRGCIGWMDVVEPIFAREWEEDGREEYERGVDAPLSGSLSVWRRPNSFLV